MPARINIVTEYSDNADYSNPIRNLTSGYTLPSGTSAFMPLRDAAPSGGMTVYTSALTSAYAMFIANRSASGVMNVSCTTSAGACLFPVSSLQVAFLPAIQPSANISVSGTPSGDATPFEFVVFGV